MKATDWEKILAIYETRNLIQKINFKTHPNKLFKNKIIIRKKNKILNTSQKKIFKWPMNRKHIHLSFPGTVLICLLALLPISDPFILRSVLIQIINYKIAD